MTREPNIILELTPLEAEAYWTAAGNTVEHHDHLAGVLGSQTEERAARRAHRKLRHHVRLYRRRKQHAESQRPSSR